MFRLLLGTLASLAVTAFCVDASRDQSVLKPLKMVGAQAQPMLCFYTGPTGTDCTSKTGVLDKCLTDFEDDVCYSVGDETSNKWIQFSCTTNNMVSVHLTDKCELGPGLLSAASSDCMMDGPGFYAVACCSSGQNCATGTSNVE